MRINRNLVNTKFYRFKVVAIKQGEGKLLKVVDLIYQFMIPVSLLDVHLLMEYVAIILLSLTPLK